MICDFLLPVCPKTWDENQDFKFHKKLSKFINKPIEPAGHAFMARVRRHKNKRTLAEDYELNQALLEAAGDNDEEEEDEPESKRLLASDPANWKTQDHYAVLGLSRKRYLATDDDIKRAYRRKVLKHHPDKKAHLGGNDNFFKCIQKAWEILTNIKKRRQWDSCDPTFDESIPKPDAKGDFYELYGPIFDREVRFSKIPCEVALGDENSSRPEVEAFYQFWFAFESWRTFEMRDEEDTDKAGSREEKRWLDRKNVAARKKAKKEDIQRINRLVDQAFSLDPRIKQFKADEKYAKNAKKREREEQEKALAAEQAAAAEKERIAAEAAEKIAKEQQQNEKKDREALKNAVKKERKAIRRMMRDYNNFLPEGATADHEMVHLEKVEVILANNEATYLESVRIKFESVLTFGHEHLSFILDEEHLTISGHTEEPKAAAWSNADNEILKKAVKAYPGGTVDRWHSIAKYVTENGEGSERSPHECIKQAKKIHAATAIKQPVAKAAPAKTETKAAAPKQETKAAEPTPGVPTMLIPEKSDWTIAQQLELEAALKKYPATAFKKNPADRWDKIAKDIKGKDKKDVKARMKALADYAKKNTK